MEELETKPRGDAIGDFYKDTLTAKTDEDVVYRESAFYSCVRGECLSIVLLCSGIVLCIFGGARCGVFPMQLDFSAGQISS